MQNILVKAVRIFEKQNVYLYKVGWVVCNKTAKLISSKIFKGLRKPPQKWRTSHWGQKIGTRKYGDCNTGFGGYGLRGCYSQSKK